MAPILLSVRGSICAAACFLSCASLALAANAADLAEAQARYRQEMAMCSSGQASQDLATCQREARNALAEARRGRVNDDSAARHQQNALQRCEVHAGDDRAACEARMRGEGRVEGSVEGGGLLREIQRAVPSQ